MLIDDGLGSFEIAELTPTSWWLKKAFIYTTDAGERIEVPAGFVTDGCSSPLRVLLKSWSGHYSTGVLIHDFLYSTGYDRQKADAILFEIAGKTGVDPFVRWAMWIAVRVFGGPIFKHLGVRT